MTLPMRMGLPMLWILGVRSKMRVVDVMGEYFDGASARKIPVLVTLHEPSEILLIKDPDGRLITQWAVPGIRQVKDLAGFGITLYQKDDETAARLTISQPGAVREIKVFAKNLNSSDLTGAVYRKVAVWTTAAAGALALMIFVIVPALSGQLAVFIPPEREAVIGKAALRQIEGFFTEDESESWFCDDPAGQAAIDKMTLALLGDEVSPYDIEVKAVNHSMINAFALPGGQIILMRGLIDRAENPGQVAGVLAHELGHVAYRDPIVHALRAAGTAGLLSIIFGDASGGTIVALVTQSLIDASNSRAAEARADDYAIEKMQGANLSPEDFAVFFEFLIEEMGEARELEDALAWASSHPPSQSRADNARSFVDFSNRYNQIITDEEWSALQNMCQG